MPVMTHRRAAVSAALSLLLASLQCGAATLNVSPVRIEIAAAERSAVVTLRNESTAPASVQADIHHWGQDEDGGDRLTTTEDLLIVPRIFTIPPGQSQVVRVGRLIEADAESELTYRLIFTELAPPGDSQYSSGIKVRLRLSLPVFLSPRKAAEPDLNFVRAERNGDSLDVIIHNAGQATTQITGFRVGAGVGFDSAETEVAVGGYLLPGSTRRFRLPLQSDVEISAVTAMTQRAGAVRYVLPGDN